MLIRREAADEAAAVHDVHIRAFPTTTEARLIGDLRSSGAWVPELSLVVIGGEGIVGHVACTRAAIEGSAERGVLGLGPIGVLPDHQGRGVGTALMHAVLAAAEARDEVLVGLLGEPRFYSRFGFVVSTAHGVRPPDPAWGRYFQVRVLVKEAATGTAGVFRYAEPFSRL